MKEIRVRTGKKDEIIDLTGRVERELQAQDNPGDGVCYVFAAHTTCCVTTADLDPGTDLDYLMALRKLLPDLRYRHPHDPGHTPDHILSSLVGPSVAVPYAGGRLLLGTWQRIVLVELAGPRERMVHLTFLRESQ